MATDLGKVGIVMKGAWNSSATYEALDAVNYNGGTYIAKQAVPANTAPTNVTYWQIALANPADYDNKNVFFVAGVLRNTGSGWDYVRENNHDAINIDSVSVDNNGDIVINFKKTASNVISFVAAPDETFVDTYSFGCSVGISMALLKIYTIPKFYGGYVYYTGSGWNYSDYSNFTGASWVAGRNSLSVSVPDDGIRDDKDAFIANCQGRDITAKLGSQGIYTSEIQFFDASGNLITTPSTSMKVYAQKTFPAKKMNANNIVSANGNIWLFGIMQA